MEKFVQFIKLYQETAENACNLLKQFLEIDTPMYWRQSHIAKSGRIGSDMEYKYSFHGTDCKFNFGGSEIDFEFGYDGRVGGFNEWKLFCFANYGTSDFTEFQDENYVKKCIENAKKDGFIDTPFLNESDDMYYLINKESNN